MVPVGHRVEPLQRAEVLHARACRPPSAAAFRWVKGATAQQDQPVGELDPDAACGPTHAAGEDPGDLEGDEIILDGYYQEEPMPKSYPNAPDGLERMMAYLDQGLLKPRLHRWRFNLKTGKTTEERLDDRDLEFGMFNQRYAGKPYRYAYSAIPEPGWFLFRVVALFVLQFFAEDVVRAVEAKHYPHAAHGVRDIPFTEEIGNALRSLVRTLLANAAALPVAALLLFTGIGAAAVFWAVNAFLIGRELRDMVWIRHRSDPAESAPMGGVNRFLLGVVVVALLAVPFINLLAPIIGAAAATHMVHRARQRVPNA